MLTNGPCTDIKKKDKGKVKVKESEIYMEDCRIIWSYNDYTTDDERIEGIKTSIEKLNTALKDYTVDIDTYKSQIRSFDEKVKSMLTDCDEDSFYFIENRYKADTEDTTWKTEGVHRTKVGLEDTIEWILDRLWKYGEIDDDECMWWEITKYVNADGYKKLYKIYLASNRTLLGLDFEKENLKLLNDDEKEIYNEFVANFSKKKTKTVVMPYLAGDIVKIDYTPYKNNEPDWLVYSGYKDYFVATGPKQVFYLTKITDYNPIVEFKRFSFPEKQLFKVHSSEDLSLRLLSGFLRENPEYFKREEYRNESRLYWLYSELMDGTIDFIPKFKNKMTLEEYKINHIKFMNHFENCFAAPLDEDELYFVCLRDNKDEGQIINDSTFGSFDKLYEYILLERFERKLEEKPYWWQIERKKMIGNAYKTIMTYNVDIYGKALSVFVDEFFCQESKDKINELVFAYLPMVQMNGGEYSVELPFKIGDIICVDIYPEGYRDCVIYLGEVEIKKGKTEPACLMYAWRSKGIFSVEGLTHLDFKPEDKYSLYPFMEKTDYITNSMLSERHARTLKIHPELVNELLEISRNEPKYYGQRDEFYEGEIRKFLDEYY